jgi:hydrogenase maturation protease
MQSHLFIGLGSAHGDDQAGWAVIDHLRSVCSETVRAIKVRNGSEILEAINSVESLVLIDSSAPNGAPGTLRWFSWPSLELEAQAPRNSHSIGMVEALRLAEVLGRIPRSVCIYTVEAESTELGHPMSRSVAEAAARLSSELRSDIEARS